MPAIARHLILLLIVASSACSPVRLISDYDEATDRGTTALHRDVEQMLTAVEFADPDTLSANAFDETFRNVLVDLRALKLRAAARPMNELQVAQFEELDAQLRLFFNAYGEGLSPAEVPLFRRGFDQTFRAILTLELAKTRGAE